MKTYFPKTKLVVPIINGGKLEVIAGEWVQYNLLLNGYYEKPETDMWVKLCKNSRIIVDIGANVGYYSILAAKSTRDRNNIIYAFEPVKHTFSSLKKNIGLNNLSTIKPFNLALSEEEGQLQIHVNAKENWGLSSVHRQMDELGSIELSNAVNFDSFYNKMDSHSIDLIKIDVEGHELHILKGMEKSIDKYKPIVLVEVNDTVLKHTSTTKEDIYDYFWRRDYSSYIIHENCCLQKTDTAISIDGLICFIYNNRLISDDDFTFV
jgi:FkbM family methyltransferase